MKAKNKKKTSIKTLIIAGIILFGLIAPKPTLAIDIPEKIFGNPAVDLLYLLTQFIFGLLGFLVRVGANFFEAMLNLGFQSHIEIVKTGWGVARDISNMFFILLMVVIAFATILRFERYGIKQLLPKIIIIALLINFSYIICGIIIDFSNITANFFISDIQKYTEKGGVSGTFIDSLSLTQTYFGIDCEAELNKKLKLCESITGKWDNANCMAKAALWAKDCRKSGGKPSGSWEDILSILISMTFGSIVLLIAAFTLFAGGILLLIRIVFVWFLVMLVPFAFICYVMPGLSSNWRDWWKNFLRWCFFAPAYAFFIWLAFKIAVENKNRQLAAGVQTTVSGYVNAGAGANLFTADPVQQLLSYGFIIALLIGGLIAANKMGIYGASTVMAIGKKWAGGVTDWAKRTAMRPVAGLGTAVGAGTLTKMGKLFGGKIGRRMEARAGQLRQAATERPEHKKYRAMAEKMSDADIKREIDTTTGPRKFIATQIAAKRGILREAERGTVRKASEAMRAFGAPEQARALEELRPDAIKNEAERKAAIERGIKEGTHKKWSAQVFEGTEGAQVVEETREQLGTNEFTKVFKGWAADIKEKAKEALRIDFTNNFVDPENIKRRKAFATITGNAYEAFFGNEKGALQKAYASDPNAQKSAKEHIQTLRDEGFEALKSNADRMLAARYMKASQVYGAGAKLSGREKELIKPVAQKYNRAAYKQMKKTDTWAT